MALTNPPCAAGAVQFVGWLLSTTGDGHGCRRLTGKPGIDIVVCRPVLPPDANTDISRAKLTPRTTLDDLLHCPDRPGKPPVPVRAFSLPDNFGTAPCHLRNNRTQR